MTQIHDDGKTLETSSLIRKPAFKLSGVALLACLAMPFSADAGLGISSDGKLIEANGKPFVMRGVNVAHAWYRDKTAQSFADISARGGNSVRVVLANGVKWTRTSEAEVATIIKQAKDNKMIAVLEVHDTTGYGEAGGMSTLDQAADYWISIKNALIGQEDYVIINIGNEPFGNNQPASAWVDGHKSAIAKLRAAGLKHTIMVDGANWGQDWQNIMRQNAGTVFNSDPLRNTIFSVHMYQVYGNDSAVDSYLRAFINARLPIVVGEFGADHQGQSVAASSILSRTRQYGIGYIGWSWSGNGSGTESLDIVNGFNGASLTSWGNMLFNDANGIAATSVRATIFDNNPPLPPAQPKPSATAGNAQVSLSWPAVNGAASYEIARAVAAAGPFTQIASGLTATAYLDKGLSNGTTYYYVVSAKNSAGVTKSNVVSARPSLDVVLPEMPAVVAAAGDRQVQLSWGAAARATGYSVERSLAGAGKYELLAKPGEAARGYLDTAVSNGVSYDYRVYATNASGNSPAALVTATPKAGGAGGCAISIDTSNDWGGGQVPRIVLRNTGTSAIEGWTLRFTESNDFSIVNSWSGSFTVSGRTVTVTPASWNASLSPNASTELGFQLSYSGAKPVPGSVSLLGRSCEVSVK